MNTYEMLALGLVGGYIISGITLYITYIRKIQKQNNELALKNVLLMCTYELYMNLINDVQKKYNQNKLEGGKK